MKIYIDILILENIVINYLILLLTARFTRSNTSHLRLFLASLVGALYVIVLLLFPDIEIYYSTAAKVALSLLIVGIAFSPERIIPFIKVLAVFYISTFIFAGAAFAFFYFNQSGGFVRNGMVYIWNTRWTSLFFAIATAGIIIKIFF